MRLRLLIPAALAAVATYTALVRDEQAIHGWAPTPEAPPTTPRPVPEPVAVAPAPPVDEVTAAPAPAEPRQTTPGSIFEDLAPSTIPPGTPTILDMLAGDPFFGTASSGQIIVEEAARAGAEDVETVAPPEAPPPSPPIAEPEVSVADVLRDVVAGAIPDEVVPPGASEPAQLEPVATNFEAPLEEGRFALGGWAASAGHSVVSAVTFRKRLPTPAAADRIVLDIDAADNVPEGGLVVLSDPGFAPDRDGFTILLAAADPGPFSAAGSYRVLPSR